MLNAMASSKVKPSFIASGAAAKAVAPDITKPCRNSGALNLIWINGMRRVNGPHWIPLLLGLFVLFIWIIQTFHLLGPLELVGTFFAPQCL